MTMRGTSLILRLPTELAEPLREHLGASVASNLLVAIQEDLLDLVATWRRVGREREVIVFLEGDDSQVVHRVARRGLTTERGEATKGTMRQRARRSLGDHRVVAVLDRPVPDYGLAEIDSLFRRAHEGLAVVADLDGDWMALGVSATHRDVLDKGESLVDFVERARLMDIAVHPLVPKGRLDSADELTALNYRIRERRSRAPRSRRFLMSQ